MGLVPSLASPLQAVIVPSTQVAFATDSYSSINSYGYSPRPLEDYIADVASILLQNQPSHKPIIISITSNDSQELRTMLDEIAGLRARLETVGGMSASVPDPIRVPPHQLVGVELNASCPNIPGKPPPSYSVDALLPLLLEMKEFNQRLALRGNPLMTMGMKLPPYVHSKQFEEVAAAIKSVGANTISFITCTNTLGSSLLFAEQANGFDSPDIEFALPTTYGGMAGDAIHTLSLGYASPRSKYELSFISSQRRNVHSFATLLAADPRTAGIKIIGVGGVTSPKAAKRMFKAGASVVACATALGKEGVAIFKRLQE